MCDCYLDGASDDVKRISCGFGGGVGGCRQELCGALAGTVIALGAIYGRIVLSDNDEDLKEMICATRDAFQANYGTTTCEPIRDMQPEMDKRCLSVVETAIKAVVGVIESYRVQVEA